MRTRIRKIQQTGALSPSDVADNFRDVQSALDSIPEQRIYVSTPQQYTEPMYFATDDARVPRIVTLARVLNVDSPTSTVSLATWCWEYVGGRGGQIKVHSILGMSAGPARYQFTWKVEW